MYSSTSRSSLVLNMDPSMLKYFNKIGNSGLTETNAIKKQSKRSSFSLNHSLKYDAISFAKVQSHIEILKMEGNFPSYTETSKMTILVLNKLRSFLMYPISTLDQKELLDPKSEFEELKGGVDISFTLLVNSTCKSHLQLLICLLNREGNTEEKLLSTKCKYCTTNVALSINIIEKITKASMRGMVDFLDNAIADKTCTYCSSI